MFYFHSISAVPIPWSVTLPYKTCPVSNPDATWKRECHQGLVFPALPLCCSTLLRADVQDFSGLIQQERDGSARPTSCNKSFKDSEITALPPHSLRPWGNPALGLRTARGPSALAGLNVWRVNRWESKELRAERTALLSLPATKPHSVLLPQVRFASPTPPLTSGFEHTYRLGLHPAASFSHKQLWWQRG